MHPLDPLACDHLHLTAVHHLLKADVLQLAAIALGQTSQGLMVSEGAGDMTA